MNNSTVSRIDGSFRDPAGFLFRRAGVLLRQVNEAYASEYDSCVSSSFFDRLWADQLLVPHEEVEDEGVGPNKYGC